MAMFAIVGVLMGQAEIAERLGVSRQRVQQLINRPDWPEPYEILAMGKVWLSEAIERWIRDHRPDLADAEPTPPQSPLGKRHGRRVPKREVGSDDA